MTRRRYVQVNGELHEVKDGYLVPPNAPAIMPDIQPYKSQITGEMITSRSHHREHLKAHGCVEIGNETEKLFRAYDNLSDAAPQQRRELIRAQVDAMSHAEFRRAIKRDVDRVKWNSRER